MAATATRPLVTKAREDQPLGLSLLRGEAYSPDYYEVYAGHFKIVEVNARLELDPGQVALIFPLADDIAGPQTPQMQVEPGPLLVRLFNHNPSRRLFVVPGQIIARVAILPRVS